MFCLPVEKLRGKSHVAGIDGKWVKEGYEDDEE